MTWPTKKTTTNTNTKTMTMTNTFKEHLQRAIFETFGLWDIWSERWENMTWPTKRQQQRRRQIQWRWQIHLENIPNEGFLETFWEHPRMAIQEKFWVWPIIHCYEFSQTFPDQTDGPPPRFPSGKDGQRAPGETVDTSAAHCWIAS